MGKIFQINIGRQLGSGGREIGKIVAEQLGISFFDNELIQIAARESGLGKEFFEQADEKDSHSIFGGMFGPLFGMRSVIDPIYSGYFLSNENLFKIQSDVIRKLAGEKSCLFVGRCADYVLKGYPRCLNVFISAEKKDRIKRVAGNQDISEVDAKDFVEKIDKKRASYYNYFSNKTWAHADSYHLCINSSVLGIDETANVIVNIAGRKFGL